MVNAVNKIALSCFDDKRYILEDTVSSLANGHYSFGNPKQISSKLQIYKEKSQQTNVRNVLFCLVDIDSISESGSSKFGGDDDDDFDSDSVISTASNQDKEAQTTSNVSSLFVNNDGPLAKAWKAASFL